MAKKRAGGAASRLREHRTDATTVMVTGGNLHDARGRKIRDHGMGVYPGRKQAPMPPKRRSGAR